LAQLNANIPYLECFIRKEFTGHDKDLYGYLFGVKAMLNRPMHFHFMSEVGAVFWNMPISAFVHKTDYDRLSEDEQIRLMLLQTWNCQSNDMAVTTFAFLQYKFVDVRCRDGRWRKGQYLFTIDDYEGDLNYVNVGYGNDQDSKCFHVIELQDGNYCLQPNNLLRWHDPNFVVPFKVDEVPRFKVWSEPMTCEDIDRTYGNSAYYFYSEKDEVQD
jgi:hypothetical protein